jgi:hypothetical protein
MNVNKYTVLLWCLFSALTARAELKAIPMIFQADKNHLEVLPQRFEYSLLDESQIKIGDILIDSATFGFQVASSVAFPGSYRARFVWPYGLVKNGTLSIRNNTGKTIWTAPFRTHDLKLVKKEQKDASSESNSALRSQLAEYMVDRLGPSLIDEMKFLPFMSFCVSKALERTRINLCSKEVFLTSTNGRLAIKARSQGKKEAFVEVNGRTVSHQGVIFLNDETQNIGFRSVSESGAILEIETRMKPVDFKDVVLSEDKKHLLLTASGTEPVTEENIQRISSDEWRATLDLVRPVLYLKGAGDIPLRQEFYVKGDIPTEAHRPSLDPNTLRRVYREDIELKGTLAPGTTASTSDKDAHLEINSNKFAWTLSSVPGGQKSRHYFQVAPSFAAGFDVEREFPWEADLGATVLVPAFQGSLLGALTWWSERFVGSEDSWAQLHWGVRASENLILNSKTGEANLSTTDVELLWRATPGFHFIDPTWGLSLAYENFQSSNVNGNTFGLGAFYSDTAPDIFKNWFQWQEIRGTYLMPSSGTVSLTQGIKIETLFYRHFDLHWSLQTGLGVLMYTLDPGSAKTQAQLKAGMTYRF